MEVGPGEAEDDGRLVFGEQHGVDEDPVFAIDALPVAQGDDERDAM
jgi:hypothetical protein